MEPFLRLNHQDRRTINWIIKTMKVDFLRLCSFVNEPFNKDTILFKGVSVRGHETMYHILKSAMIKISNESFVTPELEEMKVREDELACNVFNFMLYTRNMKKSAQPYQL